MATITVDGPGIVEIASVMRADYGANCVFLAKQFTVGQLLGFFSFSGIVPEKLTFLLSICLSRPSVRRQTPKCRKCAAPCLEPIMVVSSSTDIFTMRGKKKKSACRASEG